MVQTVHRQNVSFLELCSYDIFFRRPGILVLINDVDWELRCLFVLIRNVNTQSSVN